MTGKWGWLRREWTTLATLLVVFLLALLLRAYFAWDLAVPGGLLSGGSDAFYYERIVNHAIETGEQLVFDPRLNYPIGFTNPRPPLYSFTVAVAGKMLAPVVGSLADAVTIAFLSSTAVWGALTIFPTYFLTKEAFGKRAGLLAAFFLAFLPAHLARSPATNGDHDAMVLFFVVAGFFFFLKSLKSLNEKRWVEDWRLWKKEGRASAIAGIRTFFAENRTTVLYAMMAGWSFAAIALIWQGWAYAPIIVLVYIFVQILVHRFRGKDPMGVVIAFGIALGLPLLVALPWYWQFGYIRVWYDVPAYLWLVAMVLGVVFTVTRDYPWLIVIPSVLAGGIASLVIASFFIPGIADAFISGAGYFIQSKAFETIAEAQAPGFSQVVLSFGVATYFLSLFGLIYMAYGITKRPAPDYLFVVVWAIAAIFMAQSAARFIFNASPAFAMTSGWVTVLLLEWIKFDEMLKMFRSLGSNFRAFRRSVKIGHVLGALLIVFIILVPNVWFAVDAAIPFEKKSDIDREIYNVMPDFLRPAGYEAQSAGGSAFYLGAFGYSLPLEREYFPAAWRWFRGQDAETHPVDKRPAFLSWWDYGFEAVDVGGHPTVADNFLDGYHLAGNFITAQNESEAIALLNLRILEGDFRENGNRFSAPVKDLLGRWGIPHADIEDAYKNPGNYIPVVQDDPLLYGRYDRLQPQNAQYIFSEEILTSRLDADEQAELNGALRELLGDSIRYFAVDTRLFPLDGSNTGIFYAPAKLSDHRILELPDGRSLPRDFFTIIAETQRGNVNLEDLESTDQVTGLAIDYKEMFYNSMFYRAFVGFPPSAAGLDCTDCIPGLPSATNQQIATIPPMQAWNLSHFRVVYKTAYYNPFPSNQVANHTDAWRAVESGEGEELQAAINRGEAEGVVDLSPGSLIRRGIVFIKYYDGAIVNGTVRVAGEPWPGVHITVQDEFGIPHDTAITDADGRYSVLAPFGEVSVVASLGMPNSRTLVGPTVLETSDFTVSDAAAMREMVDDDGDGILDWVIREDFDLAGESFTGTAFVDQDRGGSFEPTELILGPGTVTFAGVESGISRTAAVDSAGSYSISGLYPGGYAASLALEDRTLSIDNLTVVEGATTMDLPVPPATFSGFVFDDRGARVRDVTISLTDLANGTTIEVETGLNGGFGYPALLEGTFHVEASDGRLEALPFDVRLDGSEDHEQNFTVRPVGRVTVRTSAAGPAPFAGLTFRLRSQRDVVVPITTDATGRRTVSLPVGTWDVHGARHVGSDLWAFVGTLQVEEAADIQYSASFSPGATVGGKVFPAVNRTEAQAFADVVFRGSSGRLRVRTDSAGMYLATLPLGTWTAQVSHKEFAILEPIALTDDMTVDLELDVGLSIFGEVSRRFPTNVTLGLFNAIPDASVRFINADGTYEAFTDTDGSFRITLPFDEFSAEISARGFEPDSQPARTTFLWSELAEFKLTAIPIPISGVLRFEGDPFTDPVALEFRGLVPGSEDANAVLDGSGGYEAALAPGRYRAEVDLDVSGNGDTRLQAGDLGTFDVLVSQPAIEHDVDLVLRSRVTGSILLSGEPRSLIARFDGPETQEVNASDGTFEIFLAEGEYTAFANVTEDDVEYAAIVPLTVSGRSEVNLQLLRTTNVTGTATHDGIPVPNLPVRFLLPGGGEAAEGTTDDLGRFSVGLIGGTYDVTVDHPTITQTAEGSRFVRFTFSGSVSVSQGSSLQLLPISLTQTLDNATVSGTVRTGDLTSIADIRFVAREGAGVDTAVRTGSDGAYSVSLQPGLYDVYAFASLERSASLSFYTAAEPNAFTLNLDLDPAHEVRGVATLPTGVAVDATVTFTGLGASVTVNSTKSSGYKVPLPEGVYAITASGTGQERGVDVTYQTTGTVDLTEATVRNLRLEKAIDRSVEVEWDAGEKALIAPGGEVTYTVLVRNTGNEDDDYVVVANGPDFTFTYSSSRLSIPFGPDNERTVRVTLTANEDARVDHGPITFTVRSEGGADPDSVVLEVEVARYRGMDADVSSAAPIWDGSFLNYTVEVHNRGNGPETYSLSLPNRDELLAAGWEADFVLEDGVGAAREVEVGSNSTGTVVLRLRNRGGTAGALARVHVVSSDDPNFEDRVTIRLAMPFLAVEGGIDVSGSRITTEQPGLDLPTVSLIIAIAAIIAAAAYLAILRRRSR